MNSRRWPGATAPSTRPTGRTCPDGGPGCGPPAGRARAKVESLDATISQLAARGHRCRDARITGWFRRLSNDMGDPWSGWFLADRDGGRPLGRGYRPDRGQPGAAQLAGSFRFVQRRAAVDERLEPGEGVLGRGTAELAVCHEYPAAGA